MVQSSMAEAAKKYLEDTDVKIFCNLKGLWLRW